MFEAEAGQIYFTQYHSGDWKIFVFRDHLCDRDSDGYSSDYEDQADRSAIIEEKERKGPSEKSGHLLYYICSSVYHAGNSIL